MRQSFTRVALSFVLLLAPGLAASQESATPTRTPLAVDVALQPEGLLIGQLVSATGAPQRDAEVRLTLADGREALAKTNDEGGFAFRGAKGVMTLQSDQAQVIVRGWSKNTAPPKAVPALLLVDTDGFARGQHYAGQGTQTFFDKSKRLFANPLFVAGVITTAVAVPLAIANDDDDPAS